MGALDAGTLGVWCTTDGMPAPDAAAFADRLVHRDAGADHVCIQPLSPANPLAADLEALDALAPTKVTP